MGTNKKFCCNDLLAPRYKLQPVMDSIYIAEGQNLKFGSVVDCKGFLCGSTHLEPYAILYEDCDTTNGAQEANVLIMGEFNIEKLVFGADATGDVLDKIIFYAKKNGIIIRPYDYASSFTPPEVSSIENVIPKDSSQTNPLVNAEETQRMIDASIHEVTLDPSEVALGNVHNLDVVTSFAADATILVDSETNGPGAMPAENLLELTTEKSLEEVVGENVKISGTFLRAIAADSKYSIDATSAFRVCSDNLNQYPYNSASGTSYTVDFTVNPDGSVKINGTATGGHALFYINSNVSGGGIVLPAGVYSIPLVNQSGVALQVCKVGTSTDISSNNGDGKTFTLTELTRVYIRIRVASGTAVSNLVVYPMICRGKYCGKYTAPLGAEHYAGLGVVIKQSGHVNFISTTSDDLVVSYKAPLGEVQKPIYVQKKADVIRVFSRIKKEYDLCIEFRKQGGLVDGEPVGGNQLFDFCRWYYLKRKFGCISTNLDNAVQININGTDYFGPYKVFATTNINGDMPDSDDFTGGNHQYNNQGSGSTATARCASITLDVDEATDVGNEFNGFADKIVIHWTNYVQATNTKKADGTGREVLREDYEMAFDGVKFVVKNAITALEAIKITTYYGLQGQQFPTISGSDMLYYEGSKTTRAAVRANIEGNCGDKNCRIIKQVGNAYANLDTLGGVKMPSYDIEMSDFDLGDFTEVTSVDFSAHASSGKVYYNLIRKDDGAVFAANDVLRFVGGYRFYDSGLD